MANTPKQPSRLRRAVEDAETHRKILELIAGSKVRHAKNEVQGMFDKKPMSKAMSPEDHEKLKGRAVDREKIGTAGAGAGFVLGTKGRELAPGAASWMVRSAKKVGEAEHMARLGHRTKQIRALSNKSGAAIVAAGLGVAGQGLASEIHHRRAMGEHPTVSDVLHKRNYDTQEQHMSKSALGLGDISKAYDPEANRHDRQAVHTGAATGGAVVAAGGSVASGVHAHRLISRSKAQLANAKGADETLRTKLTQVAKPNVRASKEDARAAQSAHTVASNARKAAGELRSTARKFHGGSVASGLAAAGLGAAAYGIQRADRKGRGQTYGYGY